MGENHHNAVDGLVNLFSKANQDLSVLHHKLEEEFQQVYPDSVTMHSLLTNSNSNQYLVVYL